VGGNGELVTHQKNGYLAKPYDAEDLARGLAWVLANAHALSRETIARDAHARMSAEALIPRFIQLYRQSGKPEAGTTAPIRRDAQQSLS
jgi:glycosyltransferase involved in cell wall biosynthesis